MRTWEILLATGIWAISPIAGSPASLVVTPTVAILATWRASSLTEALALATLPLIPVGLGYSLVQIVQGGAILGELGTGAGIAAIHGLAVAILVGLAWGSVVLAGRISERVRAADD